MTENGVEEIESWEEEHVDYDTAYVMGHAHGRPERKAVCSQIGFRKGILAPTRHVRHRQNAFTWQVRGVQFRE